MFPHESSGRHPKRGTQEFKNLLLFMPMRSHGNASQMNAFSTSTASFTIVSKTFRGNLFFKSEYIKQPKSA